MSQLILHTEPDFTRLDYCRLMVALRSQFPNISIEVHTDEPLRQKIWASEQQPCKSAIPACSTESAS